MHTAPNIQAPESRQYEVKYSLPRLLVYPPLNDEGMIFADWQRGSLGRP